MTSHMLLFVKMLKVAMSFWQRCEVWKFGAKAILYGEIQYSKKDILMF